MSKHDHKHEHCKHAEVKYCQHCDVVYCRACGHEWDDRPRGQWWYPTTWVYPSTAYPATISEITTSGNTQPVTSSHTYYYNGLACQAGDSFPGGENLVDAGRRATAEIHNHD